MGTSATPDIETVVIGAGVIGLAIAAECANAGQQTYVLERHAVETMIEVWNAKAALSQREPVHTPPSPVKLHAKGCPG